MSAVRPASLGALDLGGASTQITFIPQEPASIPALYSEQLDLYGSQYSVYTHSYLCYGVTEAYRQYMAHLVSVSFVHSGIFVCGEIVYIFCQLFPLLFCTPFLLIFYHFTFEILHIHNKYPLIRNSMEKKIAF